MQSDSAPPSQETQASAPVTSSQVLAVKERASVHAVLPGHETRSITLRAVLLGVLLIPLNAYLIIQLEHIVYQSWPTILSLFMNALFLLLMLTALNLLVGRRQPRWTLNQGELLVVYAMLCVSTALAGTDLLQPLPGLMAHATYFQDSSNRWGQLFVPQLPDWLVVKDRAALEGFYQGRSSFYEPRHLRAWIVPMAAWGGFFLVIFFIMLCINALLRKPWTERERLTYPIVFLPLELTSGPAFFRQKLLWAGIGVCSVLAIVNGLHTLFPAIPQIPRSVTLLPPPIRPWVALGAQMSGGRIEVRVYPFVVGLGLLMPVELSFSAWFFFLYQRVQSVVMMIWGWDVVPQFPFPQDQSLGVFFGICIFALWNGRRYFAHVWARALGKPSDLDDSAEPLTYRQALLGMTAGMAFLTWFSWRMGMSLWLVPLFFGAYFMVGIALARLRAELGPPAHDLPFVGPERLLVNAAGTEAFRRQDLISFTLYYWFNRSYGSHPMPTQLEAFRLAERTHLVQRQMAGVLLLAAFVGIVSCMWVMLDQFYRLGVATTKVLGDTVPYYGREPYVRLQAWLTTGQRPNYHAMGAFGSGLLITLLFLQLRLQFPSWPLHPLGLAMASTWYTSYIWFSIFVAWLIKVFLLRYGGRRGYQRILPFFFGLILGDCVWGMFWLVMAMALHTRTYSVWF